MAGAHKDHVPEKGAANGLATLDGGGKVPLTQLDGTAGTKDNLAATADPAVTDDSNAGYAVGSQWINVTTDKAWICVDASVGAAVWRAADLSQLQGTAATLDKLDATVDPTLTDDANAGYAVGSHWANVTTDELWACVDATAGAAKWKTVTDAAGAAASQTRPKSTFLGGLLDYTGADVEVNDEITFVRNWYPAGAKILELEIFPTQVGGSSRNIYLGIYDQTDVANPNLGPNNKVAEVTVFTADTVTANVFNKHTITTPGGGYTIPATGYYWHAFLSRGTGGPGTKIKPVLTADYVSGFTPVRFKAGQTSLPASAGAVTTAGGALVYIAGVE